MPFHVTCVCGQRMVVADDQSGAMVRCIQCDRALTIPEMEAPLPPPGPPAAGVDEQPVIVVDTQFESRRHSHIDRERRMLGFLALALIMLALLGAVPAALALLQPGTFGPVRLERWAGAVLLLGILQLCYSVYLLQLPDWSSLRVVSFVTLAIAALYAGVAGIRLLAGPGNRIMEFWELDGNAFSSSQEALWCFMLVLLTGSLSYLAGHLSTQWSRRARSRSTGSSDAAYRR
ncbi:MAG: hypothetical protein ACYC6N_13690 [Pirellulaceae bacterium]